MHPGQPEGTDIGPGLGHDHRGADPMSAHVAEGDHEVSVRELDEVEVVAADLLGRSRGTGDREALDVWPDLGEETDLDPPGEVHFRLPLDDAPFRVSMFDELGDITGDGLEHLEQRVVR